MKVSNTCPQTSLLLNRLLAANNDQLKDIAADEHLASCAHCRHVLDQYLLDVDAWQATGSNYKPLNAEKMIQLAKTDSTQQAFLLAKGIGLAAASVVAGLLISHTLLHETPPSIHEELAADYTLLISNDEAFPIEFFNE